MSKWIIEVEDIRAGQPRPYADSQYESILTFRKEGNPDADPCIELVKGTAKVWVRNFNEDKEAGWWEGKLIACEKLDKGKWKIIINEAYTG
jgi:hypothetical protein